MASVKMGLAHLARVFFFLNEYRLFWVVLQQGSGTVFPTDPVVLSMRCVHQAVFCFLCFVLVVLCCYHPSTGRQEKVPQLLPHRPVRQRGEPSRREVSQLLQLDPRRDAHAGRPEVLRGQ